MHCYVCNARGDEVPAVAICPRCHAGLCADHVVETAWSGGPGGTSVGVDCTHDTWSRRSRARPARPSVPTSRADRRAARV